MAKSQTTKISNRDQEVTFQRHETDSPIIPVAQLEKLNEFKPDAVDANFSQKKVDSPRFIRYKGSLTPPGICRKRHPGVFYFKHVSKPRHPLH